ncbi:MAG: kelch repeat-containing protein [Candidatus Coatesbacteria bacterium]
MKRIAAVCLLVLGAGTSLADSWSPVASSPTPRKYAAGTSPWGATLYVVGGLTGTTYLITNEVYDAVADVWTSMASMSVTRSGLVVAAIGGTIYAVSGTRGEAGLADNEAYDPGCNCWVARRAMLGPRRFAAGAVVGGKLYVTGGVVSGTILNTVEAYDPLTNQWTSKALMPTPRFLHSAVAVGGRIYCIGGITALIGGVSNTNVKIEYVGAVEVYDPATNTWTAMAPMPTPRGGAGAASPGNGMIYVAGGIAKGTSTPACERFNPQANRWDARAPFNLPGLPAGPGRVGLVVAAPPSGTVLYAVGGESATLASYDWGGNWATSGTVYGVTERYDRDPGSMVASLSVSPAHLAVGLTGSLYLDVTNSGDATVSGITGEAEVVAGAGAASISAGPFAATWFTGSLTPGATGRFIWSIATSSAGQVWFSATASGLDAEWGLPVTDSAWNDRPLTCAYPARLVSSVTLSPLPLVPGGQLTVSLTVTNEGGGTVFSASARVVVSPAGSPVSVFACVPSSQLGTMAMLSGTVIINPMSSTTFTWTVSVTGTGYALFTCNTKGTDPLFGTVTTTGYRSTMPSAPAGPGTRQGDTAALVTWLPNPSYENVSAYQVYRSASPGVTSSPALLVGTTSNTWFDDTGLVNGTRYYYVVTAMNGDGTGPMSAEVSVMPAKIPDAPGEVRVACMGTNPLAINPDRGEIIQFLVNVPAGTGTVRITVYTLAGELVREVVHAALPPGKWILDWDGRNSKGRPVASGGYLGVVDLPDGTRKIRKLAVLK